MTSSVTAFASRTWGNGAPFTTEPPVVPPPAPTGAVLMHKTEVGDFVETEPMTKVAGSEFAPGIIRRKREGSFE